MPTTSRPPWRTSSYSNGQSNCVETATQPGTVAVRDSKDPEGPRLAVTTTSWREFTHAIKAS